MYDDPYIKKLNGKRIRHHFMDASGHIPIDYADELKDAAYYIGSQLTAKKPVVVYSAPGSRILRTVSPGGYVGHIYSYVIRTDGLWWQLRANQGFVRNDPGAFDTKIVLGTASGQEHDELLEMLKKDDPITQAGKDVLTGASDTVSGIGKTLSGLGNYLPLIIIALIVIAGWYLFNSTKPVKTII